MGRKAKSGGWKARSKLESKEWRLESKQRKQKNLKVLKQKHYISHQNKPVFDSRKSLFGAKCFCIWRQMFLYLASNVFVFGAKCFCIWRQMFFYLAPNAFLFGAKCFFIWRQMHFVLANAFCFGAKYMQHKTNFVPAQYNQEATRNLVLFTTQFFYFVPHGKQEDFVKGKRGT